MRIFAKYARGGIGTLSGQKKSRDLTSASAISNQRLSMVKKTGWMAVKSSCCTGG